jgi:formylglycine-generating enzyme
MRPAPSLALFAACAGPAILLPSACGRTGSQAPGGVRSNAGLVTAPSATAAGAPRPGMAWIPAGAFHAGTPVNHAPRIAEEELPGTDIALGGFYVDVLPYPNEAGAIPTSNVTRDDAQHLCQARGKRLCTELEWERACKGPESTTYEYGDVYHAATCDTGIATELAAKRPSGQLQSCKSAFGVADMHGGPWEWTDAAWGRGSTRELGVLRGGNAVAGELVGRCANALARAPTLKSATMGLRCCAGPKNDARVDLVPRTGPPLERSMKTAELAAPLLPLAQDAWGSISPDGGPGFVFVHAWTWRPVANEDLLLATGCSAGPAPARCALVVGRVTEEASEGGPNAVDTLLQMETGSEASEVAEVGDARHLRFKGVDTTSAYLRDFTYAYGRVELGEVKR